MKNDKTSDTDKKIGIYAITGVSMLIYMFWMSIEEAYLLACVTLMLDLAWFNYSQRLLNVYLDGKYTNNYAVNYLICVYVSAAMYFFNIPMLYRNIGILCVCCEGFARTFFVEIRKFIKESNELESGKNL